MASLILSDISDDQIDWRRMVDNVFLDPIGDSEEFIVKVPNYISELDKLLSSTRPRQVSFTLLIRYDDDQFDDHKHYLILFFTMVTLHDIL